LTLPDGTSQGYEIARVEPVQGGSRVVLTADPGLRLADGKVTERFVPLRELAGGLRYRLNGQASWHRD
ncbi:MAG: hypothetical protein HUU35_14710, partial [Armatimonadetes bacterium]|nr:hypothetical protein [Armatimonadota bacterium]